MHNQNEDVNCEICNKTFSCASYLYKHNLNVHTGKRKFPCTKCDKKFNIKNNLKHHLKTIHSGQTFTCEKCNKSWTTQKRLEAHIRHFHQGIKDFQCHICNKFFTQKYYMQIHIKTVHNDERENHHCEYCGKSFNTAPILKSHIKHFHGSGGKLVYRCDYPDCDKVYARSHKLTQHKRVVHEGIKDNICDVCGKVFALSSQLSR